MENATKKTKEILLIEDRMKTELNDVEGILAFDEDYISLMTSSGKLLIEGEDLKVVDLSRDTGHVSIIGRVSAVIYSDDIKKKKRGLFR